MTVFAVEYVYAADSTAALDEHRASHRSWLAGLADDSQLLTSGPYGDGEGALLIFKVRDETQLNDLLKQDPFAIAGTIAGIRSTEWTPVIGVLAPHAS
jgi:uncharacterized protein